MYHKHGNSCYKNAKIKGCRYRKPEKLVQDAHWDGESGTVLLKKTDGFLNNFIPEIALLIQSNSDIQFLTSGMTSLSILHYVTNYITKNSIIINNLHILQKAALEAEFKAPLKRNDQLNSQQNHIRGFFIRFFNQLKKCVQVSFNEIATKLLDLPMSYSRSEFDSVNLYPFIEAIEVAVSTGETNSFQQILERNLKINLIYWSILSF